MKYLSLLFLLGISVMNIGCGKGAGSIDISTEDSAIPEPEGLRAFVKPLIKEPKYESQPRYALLNFGENAETQSWLVVDGQRVFVDKNGNGDLTDADDLVERDDVATKSLNVARGEYKRMDIFPFELDSGHKFQLQVWVKNENFDPSSESSEAARILAPYRVKSKKHGWSQASLFQMPHYTQHPVTLCTDPSRCQISNIDGSLTFVRKSPDYERLSRTKEQTLSFHIGSVGIPPTHSDREICHSLAVKEIPSEVHPEAKFEFPHSEPDKPNIVMTCSLDLRC